MLGIFGCFLKINTGTSYEVKDMLVEIIIISEYKNVDLC